MVSVLSLKDNNAHCASSILVLETLFAAFLFYLLFADLPHSHIGSITTKIHAALYFARYLQLVFVFKKVIT